MAQDSPSNSFNAICKVPNFLLAAPTLGLAAAGLWSTLLAHRRGTTKPFAQRSDDWRRSAAVAVFYFHWIALAALAFLLMHVQVSL